MNKEQQWYAVQTKPRKEFVAVDNLERQGYIAYCPRIAQAKRRRQRWQQVVEPLFPRYLFLRLDAGRDDFGPIRSTIGVSAMVRFGNRAATLPQSVINTIQDQEARVSDQGGLHPAWRQGDMVEVTDGPFAGIKGIFEKEHGDERVIILLEMLGSKRPLAISTHDIASA